MSLPYSSTDARYTGSAQYERMMRRDLPRYYVVTSYHFWSLRDRELGGEAVAYFGARQYGGDVKARTAAHDACREANSR